MAQSDGEIVIELKLQQDEFEKRLASIENKTNSFGQTFKRVMAGLGLTALAKEFAQTGISFNATIEQYETSFEVMTGSATKAKQITAELKQIAANTPFELPQLADTTQLLMNYGFTADDAMTKMQMLGDISQGSADKMTRIATAYGQMSSAGKVSLEDVKQMIEAGFNPLQEISESTGESMESLYNRISKGTISVDEITASMQRSTSEGGKYFQSMEKQSETLNGKISTLKDTFSNFAGDTLSGVSDVLTNTLIPALITLLEHGDELRVGILALGVATGAYFAYTTAIKVMKEGWMSLTIVQKAVEMGQAALNAVMAMNPIGLVVAAIAALVVGLVYLWNTSEEFRNFWIELWANVQTVTSDVINAIVNFFTVTVPEALQAMIDWFANLPTELSTWLTQTWENIKTWGSNLIQSAIDTGRNFLESVVNFFKELPGKIFEKLTEVITKVITWRTDMINKAIEVGTNFVRSVINYITTLPGKIAGQFGNVISNVVSWAREMVSNGTSAASEFVSGVVDGLSGLPDQVLSVGTNIVHGIWSGISGAAGWLMSQIKGFADNIVSNIKGFFGIKSPSRVMRDMIGKYLPPGIAVGFELAMPKATKDINKSTDSMVDEMQRHMHMQNAKTKLQTDMYAAKLGGYQSVAPKTTNNNVNLTVNSAKVLSPSEIAQENKNMLSRLEWV